VERSGQWKADGEFVIGEPLSTLRGHMVKKND